MKFEKNREENPKGDEEKEKGEEGKGPTSPCTALPPRRHAGRRLNVLSWPRRSGAAAHAVGQIPGPGPGCGLARGRAAPTIGVGRF